ncbi:chemotaxis protein CheX [Anaerotaenia torta]|uniref:chemotaxis protein CheX n=1 Tax=Anaerotaenia torta TaxID=433293 RepID=UPI003D215857
MSNNLQELFLKATFNVFQMMLDISDVTDRPADSFQHDDNTDISIEVTGDLVGEVIYHFPDPTSLKMVNIMSGMEMDSVDEFVTSAIAEIANIISGNVLTLLAENDLNCDILPPVLRKADEDKEYVICTACCITTSVGDACLDIRLNPAK